MKFWNQVMCAIFPTTVRVGLGMPLTEEQKKALEKTYPKPGELWCQHDHDDPFPPLPGTAVTILEVKADWVRYGRGMPVCTDERLPVLRFMQCYIFHKEAPTDQMPKP